MGDENFRLFLRMSPFRSKPGVYDRWADVQGVLHVRGAVRLLAEEHEDGAAFHRDA
jgi:hypothetical protein